MRKTLMLIALLTIVLAGCRVESNILLDIEEDGSALVGAEVGYDEEFAALIEDSGFAADDLFADLPTVGDGEVVAIERTEGDMTYVGAASTVDDLSDFAANSTEFDAFSSFSYEFNEDFATLKATVTAEDVGEVSGGDFGELGIDPSQITDEFFSANVVVTMPGNVTEHNADVVRSDGTLVWKVPFTGSTDITAVSSFGTSSANWGLILLVGLLVVAAIAVVAALVASRRQSQSAVDQAAASHAAATAEPSSPSATDDTIVDLDATEAAGSDSSAVDDTAVDALAAAPATDTAASEDSGPVEGTPDDSADEKKQAGVDGEVDDHGPEDAADQPEST